MAGGGLWCSGRSITMSPAYPVSAISLWSLPYPGCNVWSILVQHGPPDGLTERLNGKGKFYIGDRPSRSGTPPTPDLQGRLAAKTGRPCEDCPDPLDADTPRPFLLLLFSSAHSRHSFGAVPEQQCPDHHCFGTFGKYHTGKSRGPAVPDQRAATRCNRSSTNS